MNNDETVETRGAIFMYASISRADDPVPRLEQADPPALGPADVTVAVAAARFSLYDSVVAANHGLLGVSVQAVLVSPIDTDMVPDLPIPKTLPESVARGIFDGVESAEEEIFPDPMSATMAKAWRAGVANKLERQNAALVAADPIAA